MEPRARLTGRLYEAMTQNPRKRVPFLVRPKRR